MTLEEKAGQLFHAMITAGPGGTLADAEPAFGLPSNEAFIADLKLTHFNLFGAQDAASDIARWHNALQERAARDATRHPGHDLERPAQPLQRQPGCGDPVRTVLAVARAARPRGDPRCRPRGAVRRHRPPGIHRGRHPGRPAPAGRPRDRVSLGTPAADVRRRCPADRRTRRGVHPRLPGRRARHHLRRHDDEALPGWRAAAGRRRPALRVRPRAGLSGRAVRPAPDPLRGGVRSRDQPDHAVLRHAGRHRARRSRVRVQQVRHHRAAARALRIRRHRVRGLGRHQRPADHGPPVPRPRLGPRASDPARAPGRRSRSRCRPVRRRVLSRARRLGRARRPRLRRPHRRVGAAPSAREVHARTVR